MARGGRGRRSPSTTTKILLVVVVLSVVGLFTWFGYLHTLNNYNTPLLIDWRVKITFEDVSTGTNYTLPAGIGTAGGAWFNRTLDAFGPSGYSPMSTRDTSSTIWIQSTAPAVFNFGDFFNVWGETFNRTCVSYSAVSVIGMYCTAPSEPVIYDTKASGAYDPRSDVNVSIVSDTPVVYPQAGALLSSDSHIMFLSSKSSTSWNVNETVVYDYDNDGVYDPAHDRAIYSGLNYQNLTSGSMLGYDPLLKFYDWNHDFKWNYSVPPPVLSDGNLERCLNRALNLSNGYDWVIFLRSSLYRNISGGCIPPPKG